MRILTTLATFFCAVTTVLAQDRSEAVQELPQASRSAVVTKNVWTHLPTVDVANGRMDEELGILRAAYRLNPIMTPEATPEATVRTWLDIDGDKFGIQMPDMLELVREKETIGARHLTFQQTLAGVGVYERFVHVNLDRSGLPVMVTSGYAPHLERIDIFNPNPALSATQAESIAKRAISPDGATSDPPELLVLPDRSPRLIWRIIVWPDSFPSEWEVLLDANTGALIQLMDQRIFSRPKDTHGKADGEGYVWLFDPLTASGQPYGGDYTDNNDQDNATLNNLRNTVTLQGIKQGNDGLYKLTGPWVRITGNTIPKESDPTNFKYTRSDDRFEAVMAYYFIDENQRYVQSLNVGHPAPENPIKVDPHVTPADQSWFSPRDNFLGFGDGGVDDAEDAGVILHEYGHAVMQYHLGFIKRYNDEQNVLSEGFADYWAVSYRRHLMESGQVPQGDWRDVFPWDGIAWGGRRADGNEHYDAIRRNCVVNNSCNYYYYGTTWAALMMKLWEDIGRENADRLHLAAFPYLGPNFTLIDMVEALLRADSALHGGRYSSNIFSVFQPKGFISSQSGVPTITHKPLPPQFNLTDPVKFEADIKVTGPSITSASVNYRIDSGIFQTRNLTNEDGSKWSTEILLPPTSTLLEYYIRASTDLISVTLPKSAPDELWQVRLGADTQAPTITYTPDAHVTRQEALLPFSVQVTDNDKVSQVTLEYMITYPGSQNTTRGTLSLVDAGNGTYTFKLPFSDTSESSLLGAWMEYRIVASDAANPPNVSTFPSMGQPLLRLDVLPSANELANWQPDAWPKLPAGEWVADSDIFGSTGSVWTTVPEGSYSDQPSLSLLTFPAVNVVGAPNSHLEFWHWYDFEHSDVPGPGDAGGIIYDGGQIQFSTDGGQSWTAATPQWGYNGTVDVGTSNPLSGTRAFGGSSFGWRRVRVPLPDAPEDSYRFEVSTRLAFGTGTGNAYSTTDNFAGWAVRNARVLIDPPVDNTSPTIQESPSVHQFVSLDQTTIPIQIVAMDDPGIESVRLHLYDVKDAQINHLGTYRLVPLRTNPNRFTVKIPVPESQPGRILGYHITVRDFDNNSQILGEESAGKLLKLYVPSENPRVALPNAYPSGAWTELDKGYLAQTDTPHQQSSIVLSPVYFSTVSERTMFRLRHKYRLSEGSAGRVHVTEDGGTTWKILAVSGHQDPDTDQPDAPSFSGDLPEITDSWFDLTSLKQPYQLRLDLTHGSQKAEDDFWQILSAEYYRLAKDAVPVPVATDLVLYPNFPNPFRDETTISYVLPEAMNVRISLFNALGQNVRSITNRRYEAGGYAINLDLRSLAPGIYWVRMEADEKQLQQSITLVR